MTLARHFGAGLSTKDYGYLGGGEDPSSVKSTVDRLDFSTDTTAAVEKGPLTSAKKYPAGTGSTTHGYFAGGRSNPGYRTTVHRIDYSNDLAVALVKGPITSARYHLAATGTPVIVEPSYPKSL